MTVIYFAPFFVQILAPLFSAHTTRKGYAASVTLLRRERLRYHVAALLAMTKTLPYLSLRAEGTRRGNLVQELPSACKLVHPYRLPLRGRHAGVVVPYDR